MVPPETVLALQFDVNRHTFEARFAALGQEALCAPCRAVGTLIERKERLSFPSRSARAFSQGSAIRPERPPLASGSRR